MKEIIVLGSGCKKCHQTQDAIVAALQTRGLDVPVELDTNPATVMKYKVMRTPAVVIDEQLVHFGSVPSQTDIESWLKES